MAKKYKISNAAYLRHDTAWQTRNLRRRVRYERDGFFARLWNWLTGR